MTIQRLLLLSLLCLTSPAFAQAPPQPLGNPPIPPGNPQTASKIALGKILFWEEQLSATGTVSCGTCHRAVWGGTDPRTRVNGLASTHPGPDNVFGNADDVLASAGVPAHVADGSYTPSTLYGFAPQVGRRKSPSAVNAAYSPLLFWDGRAVGTFTDPQTGQVLLQQGGALENQALGPVVDTSEMAHAGATLLTVAARLSTVRPLALANNLGSLQTFIAGRDYAAMFTEVFGTPEISPARIALAIASYERTLNANQTPFDAENGGTPSLNAQELQGRQLFVQNDCAQCHAGALTSDNQFHYIGVRPVTDDLGRFALNNDPNDRGAFKTPSLRNVELRAPYFHNGRFATLEDVVAFYARGGDFDAPNKDPRVRPRNLNPGQRAAIVAFLKRPLTDPRVGAELPPFDRPMLYTESDRVPAIVGTGIAGSGAQMPQLTALEPPLLGNTNFTVVVSRGLGGASATLVVGNTDPGAQNTVPTGNYANIGLTLGGSGNGNGFASVQLPLVDNGQLLGQTLWGRFYIADAGAPNGIAVTHAFRITVFGESGVILRDGFE